MKKSRKLKVFTLSLKKWLRGRGGSSSELWLPLEKVGCCLGLLAIECGLSKRTLIDAPTPSDLRSKASRSALPNRLFAADGKSNSALTDQAMRINDSRGSTDQQKVKSLRPIFRKLLGYRIVVVP